MLVIAAVALGAAAVLLLAPVRVCVEIVAVDGSRRADWQVRWLFLTWNGTTSPQPARRQAKPKRPARRRRAAKGRRFRWRAALGTPGVARRAVRLVRELLRPLQPRDLDATVRIGLDDPAVTGSLAGIAAGLAPMLPAGWQIRVEPEFSGASLAGRARARWSVAPGQVLWPIVTFMSAPVVWRAARKAWFGSGAAQGAG